MATLVRADHARDWWPRSIALTARDEVERWPGVVVRPHSTSDVVSTLRVAHEFHVAVTAQGGRSGVVGGAAPDDGAIALDLTGLDGIIDLDEVAGLVRVQAGVFGPDLEAYVNERGFTVGHFPQSFDLATVGGWIACRGAGQYSNRFGKIEDIVRGLTVVLANGDIIHVGGHGPRQSVGPDLLQLFVGSEGTLGIITEATLVARRQAAYERRAAYQFDAFDDGMEACRRILQRDAHPAVLRLYDEAESKRNFELDGCALVVLDEGDPLFVDAALAIVAQECTDAASLEEAVVERWLAHRNDVSALAPLWERGLVVDTIEIAGSWNVLANLRNTVTSETTRTRRHDRRLGASITRIRRWRVPLLHLRRTSSGVERRVLPTSLDVAISSVIASGGAISHHHGIGRNRARFVKDALGDAYAILEAAKAYLDPDNILNPGVLGIGGDPW